MEESREQSRSGKAIKTLVSGLEAERWGRLEQALDGGEEAGAGARRTRAY